MLISQIGVVVFTSPQEFGSVEEFQTWFAQCAEVNEITFESYGLQGNPIQAALMDLLEQKLTEDFGANCEETKLSVYIVRCEAGMLQETLESDQKSEKNKTL